jgi:transposase
LQKIIEIIYILFNKGENMSRPPKQIPCDAKVRAQLIEITRSRTQASGLCLRARIVLRCLEGEQIQAIAKAYNMSNSTIIRWKNRFIENGIAGLMDHARSGRPATYQQEFKQAVLTKLEHDPPKGFAQWDGVLLAQELDCSKHAIWRLLREQRISLARRRSWCVSTDPEFVPKAADVVGMYLTHDENALVICVDEKPNIQALERLTGYAVSSDRKLIRGIESTYERHGTANLFAALEIATGRVHGKMTDTKQKTKKGFLSFMDDLLAELPVANEYHVILDNHSIHKPHELWLEQHENVFFHYTPTSASWLNMVEIWLGILTRKSLRGASFTSIASLCEHIGNFVAAYNQTAKPFVWRKREVQGAQLTSNAQNFCN